MPDHESAAVRAFAVTITLGLLSFTTLTLVFSVDALGDWAVLVHMLAAVAFGALAPSRVGALLTVALVPFLAMAQCGASDAGLCGSEGGFPFYLLLFWWLLMLPMLLGVGLAWSLGLRWMGGRLTRAAAPRPQEGS